jgi:putative ABC transport system substrate-binding protein
MRRWSDGAVKAWRIGSVRSEAALQYSYTPVLLKQFGFSLLLCALLVALSSFAAAQEPRKSFRIGYLSPRNGPEQREEIFSANLRDLGYIEGRNVVVEWRFAQEKPERLRILGQELVQLNVDVIVTFTTPAIKAAKEATKTIPIVMANVGDPIAAGFVASLARPGGNITGLSTLAPELNATTGDSERSYPKALPRGHPRDIDCPRQRARPQRDRTRRNRFGREASLPRRTKF